MELSDPDSEFFSVHVERSIECRYCVQRLLDAFSAHSSSVAFLDQASEASLDLALTGEQHLVAAVESRRFDLDVIATDVDRTDPLLHGCASFGECSGSVLERRLHLFESGELQLQIGQLGLVSFDSGLDLALLTVEPITVDGEVVELIARALERGRCFFQLLFDRPQLAFEFFRTLTSSVERLLSRLHALGGRRGCQICCCCAGDGFVESGTGCSTTRLPNPPTRWTESITSRADDDRIWSRHRSIQCFGPATFDRSHGAKECIEQRRNVWPQRTNLGPDRRWIDAGAGHCAQGQNGAAEILSC